MKGRQVYLEKKKKKINTQTRLLFLPGREHISFPPTESNT